MAEWKPFDLTWGRSIYYCSVCEESVDMPTVMGKPKYKFCPNCGAKMIAEQTEPNCSEIPNNCEDEPHTERIKTLDYCDICNHRGCDNCIANNLDVYCVPSGYAQKDTPQTDLLVKTPHKSRESHEKNCETCRDKDAYDEWEGNCDECENGSMYTPQTDKDKVVCPNCGRSDYIRSFEKDFNIKNSGYRYKCINCNTYIKDTPQTDCDTCRHYKLACELFSEVCKYEPTTQTETQNSNLTFEKDDENEKTAIDFWGTLYYGYELGLKARAEQTERSE